MRLPNTASASPVAQRRDQRGSSSGAYWPSPCTIATKSKPSRDGVGVADLLVAAVALVVLVAQHRHRGSRDGVCWYSRPISKVRSSEASSTTRTSQSKSSKTDARDALEHPTSASTSA